MSRSYASSESRRRAMVSGHMCQHPGAGSIQPHQHCYSGSLRPGMGQWDRRAHQPLQEPSSQPQSQSTSQFPTTNLRLERPKKNHNYNVPK